MTSSSLHKTKPLDFDEEVFAPSPLLLGETNNLALGDESDSPFRAMDEFDVFMDAVNRRLSIETLLNFARENVDKQFLFITPQDISAVDATAADIKIQKMRAARPE